MDGFESEVVEFAARSSYGPSHIRSLYRKARIAITGLHQVTAPSAFSISLARGILF
jgi:hypothetical protein